MSESNAAPLWSPALDVWDRSRIGAFARRHQPDAVGDYNALWAWSVAEPARFWSAVALEFDVAFTTEPTEIVSGDPMPYTRWFAGAELNYARHMLRGNGMSGDDPAVLAYSQTVEDRTVTLDDLRLEVSRAAAGLRRLGVEPGDRVAGFLPNVTEALVAFLATASIGAVWTSCAPEFGVRAVLDRWSQVEPKVLLTIDGYRYGAKEISLTEVVSDIRAGLPSLRHTVALGYLGSGHSIVDAVHWSELVAPTDEELVFQPVPFDHPLYILYSSGTTGLPKPIVHGHGGVLLEHAKQIGLQMDLGPGDRFFWFSTTGWMMWNFVISGLLVGSSVVVFDGNPGHPDLTTLWSLVADSGSTFAGFSAPFIMACRSAGLEPAAHNDLSALRAVGSTGAPLPASGFHWLNERVGSLPVASIAGGTDVCSAFLGGAPVLPVSAGVIPCRQLGWNVDSFDPDGRSVRGEEGELVITGPAPSMPVSFWGDEDGSRYRGTYLDAYPGVWRHGDWITINDDGTSVISGRSDATLNRGGVRLGTADFYSIVESDPSVADSLVVHLEDADGGLGELILFVVPKPGFEVDDDCRTRIVGRLRTELSPRHAPDEIVAVGAVPRTLSGKKLEIPVKRILTGTSVDKAASTGALADPKALDHFVALAESRKA